MQTYFNNITLRRNTYGYVKIHITITEGPCIKDFFVASKHCSKPGCDLSKAEKDLKIFVSPNKYIQQAEKSTSQKTLLGKYIIWYRYIY